MSAAAALAILLVAPPKMDFREHWACSERSEADGVRVDVIRILDEKGVQLRADVQWFAFAKSDQLHLWGISAVEGPTDPPVLREIDVSSLTNQNNPEAPSWSLRLHPEGQATGGLTFPFSEAPIGATLRWQQVERLVGPERPAMLTLTDASGRKLAARAISAEWLAMLERRLRDALSRTKKLAGTPASSCDPVTEWMRL